jgi:AcrR family transcriptional regulator
VGSRLAPSSSRESRSAAPRQRRRSGEVQALILEAARRTFAAKGYARTTTREIAARAAVAETLLFRKFGSKAALFAEAVLHPMAEFIRGWIAETPGLPSTRSAEEAQRSFLDRLYGVASAQRGLLLTLFATSVFEPEVLQAGGGGTSIQGALDELVRFTETQLIRLGIDIEGLNVPIASRSVIGMVLAMALFGDWLLPAGRRRPSRATLLDELTRQVLYGGFNQRPNAARRPGRRQRG